MPRAVLLLMTGLMSVAAAAAGRDACRAQLAGEWDLTGTTRAQAVHYRVHGHWVLGAGGTLLIEAQRQDGGWSTFGSYPMRRPGFPPGMH